MVPRNDGSWEERIFRLLGVIAWYREAFVVVPYVTLYWVVDVEMCGCAGGYDLSSGSLGNQEVF